jgi:hypothetical protein
MIKIIIITIIITITEPSLVNHSETQRHPFPLSSAVVKPESKK